MLENFFLKIFYVNFKLLLVGIGIGEGMFGFIKEE